MPGARASRARTTSATVDASTVISSPSSLGKKLYRWRVRCTVTTHASVPRAPGPTQGDFNRLVRYQEIGAAPSAAALRAARARRAQDLCHAAAALAVHGHQAAGDASSMSVAHRIGGLHQPPASQP